ncbi:MAG: sulfate adenylyltransferase subunit 2, partial [Polyangiaceae bacterium]|nr:sulfate adenylyltransferase subunit 2 [Polyangiaceae bacterium]
HPARIPFPLLHIDTGWKFREMYAFRDRVARELGLRLIVHVNEEGRARGINPLDHGAALHTEVMKTEALRQALAVHGFDAAIGGARRDEERSRAKERIFSVRYAGQRWDPRRQRPEFWELLNGRLGPGETMRVFPLSDWTELDVWLYVRREGIEVVPLYFAKERPVVEHQGALIVLDDPRFADRFGPVRLERVRFRSLGCWPLSGAIRSDADTLDALIAEQFASRHSERQGRLIDHDEAASMERKQREGFF